MMEKRWRFRTLEQKEVQKLAGQLHISPVLARVLLNRGIDTASKGEHFLHDTLADLPDPFLMKGMKKAVQRLSEALDKQENIVIYGDYDVDGITSTSLVYDVLHKLGGQPDFYIPERQKEGYGLNETALAQLSRQYDLLITVDCGISSAALVEKYRSQLDIIITDHHEPPEVIPPALAVLDPKQKDCAYPYKELAGAGVAYMLCRALWQQRCGEELPGFTDLAALGTIADLVPLTGENRTLVRYGLAAMQEGKRTGLTALLQASGLSGKAITAGRIAFTAAPRLNAAGRISHASRGVRLLLETDADKARAAAEALSQLNAERQEIEHTIAKEAVAQIEAKGQGQDEVLIAWHSGWHVGVIGIAASRLVEKYYRPSLVITVTGGIGKGSCRSIPGFNMYEALTSAADLLIQFGGHTMAAGFSIKEENIEKLRQRLITYARVHLTAEDYIPLLTVDEQLRGQDITLELIDELSRLEPYGMGNSRPVFSLSGVQAENLRTMGKEQQHLRLTVRSEEGEKLTAIGWSRADLCEAIVPGDSIDLAFQLERNEYNGLVTAQLILQDVHFPARQLHLNRTIMIDVYMALKKIIPDWGLAPWQVRQRLAAALEGRYEVHVLYAALTVLREIGVLGTLLHEDGPYYYFPILAGKMDLHKSPAYEKYCED